MWKEAVVAISRYYPSIFLEGLEKTTKTWSQRSLCPAEIRTEHLRNSKLERYISLSMALQPFGPWQLFQFLNPIHSR
jgi:hypothetical protein